MRPPRSITASCQRKVYSSLTTVPAVFSVSSAACSEVSLDSSVKESRAGRYKERNKYNSTG